tara:strand:+ start:873 stop:1358 length:486 start_codon:yes stop_codon:yes gene_type:complete
MKNLYVVFALLLFYSCNIFQESGYRIERGYAECVSGDCEDGQGTLVYNYKGKKMTVYVGSFEGGDFHGKGTKTFGGAYRYIGEFVDGAYEGKGSIFYGNGDMYVGEFDNGMLSGKGVYIYNDGTLYEGQLDNGIRSGQGTLTLRSGTILSGLWKNGELEEN